MMSAIHTTREVLDCSELRILKMEERKAVHRF